MSSSTASNTTNGRHLFKEYPTGFPTPGQSTVYDTSASIDLDHVPLNGGVLTKLKVLSIDPYLRELMNPNLGTSPDFVPFALNEPIQGHGIVEVLRSENDKFKSGDFLHADVIPHEEYPLFSKEATETLSIVEKRPELPLSVYVGAARMPGWTAFAGWKEYAKAKTGETVFVSSGAGAVGSIVVQLAKHQGLKVISSAGSEDKVQFLKDLGVDVAFNYKTSDTREVLKKEGPVDIYWDHVGGDTLDAALENMNQYGRIVLCGMITGYNTESGDVPTQKLYTAVWRQLSLHGLLIVPALIEKYQSSFEEEVVAKLADGTFKYREDKRYGLEEASQAMLDVQKGSNVGKCVVVVDGE
ncbi:alcohol dehydrogenase [Pterulicium gracile]|uniref:Alcohol dehydrogenase n=1 Tax=Pterulicium gracile TaxID=1884261 RepID=A0A5C3Q7T5_9AGAR|nr:alcohol dehydrogenase [Pterula gracilis]